jgi:hypothetical protein
VRLGLSAADTINALSAAERLSIESSDLDMLDEPDATLFSMAPNTGTAAGAAVALIEAIIRRFRKKTANHQLDHRLLPCTRRSPSASAPTCFLTLADSPMLPTCRSGPAPARLKPFSGVKFCEKPRCGKRWPKRPEAGGRVHYGQMMGFSRRSPITAN